MVLFQSKNVEAEIYWEINSFVLHGYPDASRNTCE